MPSHLKFLPSLDIISKISGIPHLDNSDTEDNIPNPINYKYHYFHDFEKVTLPSDKSSFSFFHIVTILRDPVTTSWCADDSCLFGIK